jgi:sec-independent protein translocase protein TatA
MGSFSIWHWLVVLVIVLVIFGSEVGSDLGSAVTGFKDGMKTCDVAAAASPTPQVSGQTIDVEAKKETSSKV